MLCWSLEQLNENFIETQNLTLQLFTTKLREEEGEVDYENNSNLGQHFFVILNDFKEFF